MAPHTCSPTGWFVLAALIAAAASCTSNKYEPPTSENKSQLVPEMQAPVALLDLEGNPVDLWQQTPDHVIVVVFTRSDCPISNRFAPEICRLYELYHPQGVDFCLIYVDPSEKPEAIRQHLKDYGYHCQALRDPRHSLVSYCNATITPEAVVFDRDRNITYQGRVNDLYVELGKPRVEATSSDLSDAIEATLHGQPVATPRTQAIGCTISDLKD